MKLTVFSDYALRVLMHLALRPLERQTAAEIAEAFAINQNHLMKVIHGLSKGGWVVTSRGKGGGLTLAMPADKIMVGQVVRFTEREALPPACFADIGSTCKILKPCRLKRVLAEALEGFFVILDEYSIADLVKNSDELSVILFHPSKPSPTRRSRHW